MIPRTRATRATAALLLLGALLLAPVVLRGVGIPARSPSRDPGHWFGTLLTQTGNADAEYAAGVRVAHLQISWASYEPGDGVFDGSYAAQVTSEIDRFRAAGMLVEAGVGLDDPPGWLVNGYPGAAFTDQFGDTYQGDANLVFSATVREKAGDYLARLAATLPLSKLWAVRVGTDPSGEFAYPPSGSYAGHSNVYWAFDANAQAPAGASSGRPATVAPDPFPGWVPGQRTWDGQPFTVADVRTWYHWYLASLADAVNWQISTYRTLGFTGLVKVLVPGSGFSPGEEDAATGAYLDGSVRPELMGTGTGFFDTIGMITDRSAVIVATSLVDGTGTPTDNGCQASDSRVDVTAGGTADDLGWSSPRWIAAVAHHFGFTDVAGESAGPQVNAYGPRSMATAARQMASCGMSGLMWAFDFSLYNGTPGTTLADYAAVIRRYA